MKKDIKDIANDNYRIYKKTIKKLPWILEDVETYNFGKFDTHPLYEKIKSMDGGNVNWLNFIRTMLHLERNDMMDFYLMKKRANFNTIRKVIKNLIINDQRVNEFDNMKELSNTSKTFTKKQLVHFLSKDKVINKKLQRVLHKVRYAYTENSHEFSILLNNFIYFNKIELSTAVNRVDDIYSMKKLEDFVDNFDQKKLDKTDKLIKDFEKLEKSGGLNHKSLIRK